MRRGVSAVDYCTFTMDTTQCRKRKKSPKLLVTRGLFLHWVVVRLAVVVPAQQCVALNSSALMFDSEKHFLTATGSLMR